jgi:hypothetical protein
LNLRASELPKRYDKHYQNAINSLQIAASKRNFLKKEASKLLKNTSEKQLQKIRDILAGGDDEKEKI